MPAKPVVEVVSVSSNIVVRPVPTADAVNWAALMRDRHPGDMTVSVPVGVLARVLRLLGDKAGRLP